ncbi:tripartite tricarboxylate transporter TctB family protein [Vicingus serpentipes]|uniref:Tripartite tricarboxylate transporter TctB family protein n=1 Tax=Vicingus serpentipes TaxID=1926625 RepID=A0A5C6RZY9_9FLAO|nr:tripartite tricarboxylate transporter TctB family protein [Vicingus serpentipes]TXB66932.1 tripartite tricarboxylate transporter TctB family protein [Vicingus serpentipes]
MVCLNENQVDEIRQLIEARGAEMEELTNDLLDHICCMIEDRMSLESDFHKVLQETMAVFGNNGIRNIQDETTFLLTKNILAMKKTTHIIGITSAILLLLATLFKIYHWPGAGMMYVLGGFLLSFIFLPLMLTIKIKEKISKPRIWLNVAGTLSGFIMVNGIFFKVMHWPYANMLTTAGMIIALFVFLPLYIYAYIRNKEMRTTTITTAVLVVGAMSMLFALVKLHNSGVVTEAMANIHYNMNNEIDHTIAFNEVLFNELKNDSTVDVNLINEVKTKAAKINETIQVMNLQFSLAGNEKLAENEIKQALDNNYPSIMNGKGDLNAIRSGSATIEDLMLDVTNFEGLLQQVFGSEYKVNMNKSNFDIYSNSQYNDFPLEIVVNDLTFLNIEVQRQYTSLLLAIKK